MIEELLGQFGISECDQTRLIEKMKPVRYDKGQVLENPIKEDGQPERNIYFIKQGILRVYHYLDDEEVNTYFAGSGEFISAFGDIITDIKSHQFIAAIEGGLAMALNSSDYKSAFDSIESFDKVGRYFAEKNYLCLADRMINMHYLSGYQKHQKFLQDFDQEFTDRLPNYHVASYLGMTPESLSRIKAQKNRK